MITELILICKECGKDQVIHFNTICRIAGNGNNPFIPQDTKHTCIKCGKSNTYRAVAQERTEELCLNS